MAQVNMTPDYADRLNKSIKYTEGFIESPMLNELGEIIPDETMFAEITEVIAIGDGAATYVEYKAIEVFFNQSTGAYESVSGHSRTWDTDLAVGDLTLALENLVPLDADTISEVGAIVTVNFITTTVDDDAVAGNGRHCFGVGGGSAIGFCDIISGSLQNYIGFITTTPGGSTAVGGSAEDPMAEPNTIETGATIIASNLLVGSLDITQEINYYVAQKIGENWHIEPSGIATIGFAALGSGSGKDYTGTIRTLGGGLGEVIEGSATIRAENLEFGSISGDDYIAHLIGEVWHVQPSTF